MRVLVLVLVLLLSPAVFAQSCGGPGEVACNLNFGEPLPEPESPPDADLDLSALLSFFTGLKGFEVIAPPYVCEPLTANIYGTDAYFNFHCTILEYASYILFPVFVAFWIILALFVVMGA